MFGTFPVTVDGSGDLYRGAGTLHRRHETRTVTHFSFVNLY
jgi:hypothetical protein